MDEKMDETIKVFKNFRMIFKKSKNIPHYLYNSKHYSKKMT